ncbi:MAG: hypothetical protein WCC51_17115 [Stenotrophomonas indicatrix]|uniref:hypothetical protein n=1 Tax=Stenotrophomonas indicatrix TaxID=2045451 RepID=UPI003C7B32A4
MAAIEVDDVLFDAQLIIGPSILAGSRLLIHLQAWGEFDINTSTNWLYLPIEQEFADDLGCARYAGEPIESYTQGMLQQLAAIEASPDGQGALEGDLGSTVRALEAARMLQEAVKVALNHGDLALAYGS